MDIGRGTLGHGHWERDTRGTHGHWYRGTRTWTLEDGHWERGTRTWTLGGILGHRHWKRTVGEGH